MTASDGGVLGKRSSGSERLTPRRLIAVLIGLIALLLMLMAAATAVGGEHISLGAIIDTLAARLTGNSANVGQAEQTIIVNVRLPRVLMAMVVGAALSVAGAAYQSLLRNPLADPYILGVSTGAALGAILATVFAQSAPISRPLAAFIGAAVTTAAVYWLGQKAQDGSSERLVLAGMIVNAFLSSSVIFFLTVSSEVHLRSVFSWLLGYLGGEEPLLLLVGGLSVVGIAIIYLNARNLNLLMVGEQDALALGVDVRRVKLMVYIAASMITGAAVAVGGVIGFVGLVMPHAVRLMGGSDNRLVIPGSALGGAAFLLVADTMARTVIAPSEIHIGVVTAIVGAPGFVYLLRRTG
jgi:iron complex transport system permease protein